jgi:hypothetical protein
VRSATGEAVARQTTLAIGLVRQTPRRQSSKAGGLTVNPVGGSGEVEGRDSACTPAWLAKLIGPVDVDPCSNPRSHIQAVDRVMLENGGDGLFEDAGSGHYLHDGMVKHADDCTQTFDNPPYARGQVIRWVRHWYHTDFIFLLRWDPSPEWFFTLLPKCAYVWFPYPTDAVSKKKRLEFEPPPGVTFSSNPFPHALYLRERPNEALRANGWVLEVDSIAVDRLLAAHQDSQHDEAGRDHQVRDRDRTTAGPDAGAGSRTCPGCGGDPFRHSHASDCPTYGDRC